MRRSWNQQFKPVPAADRTSEGIVFDSRGERDRWDFLRGWEAQGSIRNLKRQVRYKLILPDGTPIQYPASPMKGKNGPGLRKGVVASYTTDFEYDKVSPNEAAPLKGAVKTQRVIEEYKGFDEKAGRLRRAVFEAIFKVKVRVVKKAKEAL